MEKNRYLLSTAYFPPVHYFSLLSEAEEVYIETEENYLKQTYRNRCIILSANGQLILSVPVFTNITHKTKTRDLKIDYSKRWQQLHLRGLNACYRSSPFFEFYIHLIESVVTSNHKYLIDLNMHSVKIISEILKTTYKISYTKEFKPVSEDSNDFRYIITPKKALPEGMFVFKEYAQVFENRSGFIPGLSILDLLFNLGPDSPHYIRSLRNSP